MNDTQRAELLAMFKQCDWYYNYAEGNAYYAGRESYEKTMRMVAAAGDEGRKLMEEYRAEHRIES
ncbi:MAG: hypothetical protein LW632_11915 [Burkholderiaceae bacterium]|jgi:hypothetical protein|nr:hypothetical protein [Burkholderiaceae bacterium]